jgi:hypothetical protein
MISPSASVYSTASISTSRTSDSNSDSRSLWIRGRSSSISSESISPQNLGLGIDFRCDAFGFGESRRGGWVLGISRPAIIESNTISKGLTPTSTETAVFAASPLLSRASLIAASFTGSATFGSVVMLRSSRASRSEAADYRPTIAPTRGRTDWPRRADASRSSPPISTDSAMTTAPATHAGTNRRSGSAGHARRPTRCTCSPISRPPGCTVSSTAARPASARKCKGANRSGCIRWTPRHAA